MGTTSTRCAHLRAGGRRRPLAREHGFTLIETVLAMAIFVGVATSLAGVLTSSIAAHTVSRERTVAEQIANDQVESIRRLPYDDVGTVGGNPPGTVAASRTVTQDGLTATVSTQISYVNDPIPTSYATGANYKRVTVTVTRARDGKQLTRVVTNIAPPARAPYGGINNAIVNVQVLDYALLTPVPGASVTIANGPSPSRTDVTDSSGTVSFAALTPNPLTGPTAYYDLTVSDTGYVTFPGDVPPAAAAHLQLSPSQTVSTAIRIFKPVSIILQMVNANGSPYTGTATVKVTSGLTGVTETIVVTGGSATLTELGGDPIVPGVTYTVKGLKANGQCADPAPRYVPDNYPTDLTTTFVLTWGACPSGTLAVNVKQLGLNVPAATVDVTGGPNGVSLSGTTDSNGDVSFAAPEGAGYTVTATKGSATASTTASVTAGTTTNVTVTLPPPPTGTIVATVNWDTPLASCANCVTLSGGPNGISVTGSTDGSGQVTFLNVPVGSGYTITATKNGVSGSSTASVAANATTNVVVALPTGTLDATVTYGGVLAASGATITVSGGPNAVSVSGTTNASGVFSDTLPAGTTASYTITATKAGQSVSGTFTLPANGSTAALTLNLPVGTVNATVRWGSAGPFSNGAAITVSGGPVGGTVASGSTNASGSYSNTSLPAGTGTYTIQATKGAAGASTTFTIPSSGSTATVTLTLPVRATVLFTVKNNKGTNVGAGVPVTMTGGPEGLSYSGTTNASGQVSFTNVPAASDTYVAKAWNCASTAGKSRTNTITVTSGTTTQSFTLQYNSNTCPP
ncbi:hypothetical protein [Gaiella occulta]|uniref:hypothetical protein n=1 Tax=Gaiella occulta TaxID=1002870 RepID=UPI0015F12532|nr:hypothetical protein [Gaiella occulta]